MLNCKQAIELSSTQLDKPLPWLQRWRLRLHLLLCKSCQRYMQQIRFIQKAAQTLDQHYKEILLPDPARKRISKRISQSKL